MGLHLSRLLVCASSHWLALGNIYVVIQKQATAWTLLETAEGSLWLASYDSVLHRIRLKKWMKRDGQQWEGHDLLC